MNKNIVTLKVEWINLDCALSSQTDKSSIRNEDKGDQNVGDNENWVDRINHEWNVTEIY